MIEIMIGVALLFVFLGALRWFSTTDVKKVSLLTRVAGASALGVFAIAMLAKGRIFIAIPAFLAAMAFARGWLARTPRSGPKSPGGGQPAPRNHQMSAAEAYEILGLKPGATDADIKAAHRRLMAKIHPDHGGSDYLAAKINQAKDFLLKQ